MPTPKLPKEILYDTLRALESCGNNNDAAARQLGIHSKTMFHRVKLARIEFPNGIEAEVPKRWTYPRVKNIEAPNTKWIIGSDLHIWDAQPTLIFQAFQKLAKQLKVDGIILNGDVIDGARISSHRLPRQTQAPKINVEIESAKKLLKSLPKCKHMLWTLGNHDIRIDNYVASNANELSDYIISLQEHFPNWDFSYAFDINGTEIRHRFRGGIHSAWNNTLHSGINIITGHTHQLQVTAVRDRNGSRYGVETGMMADPFGPQFEYTEGAPSRSQQGFVVISFDEDGYMFPPEICEMVRGRPVFRGGHVL
jgi:predicted phosphodiesterase